jgi:hypothetical protein
MRLVVPDTPRCEIPTPGEIRWTALHIVGIGSQNVHVPFIQETLGPISRIAAKSARERPGGHLHPDTGLGQPFDHRVMAPDPSQTLRMGQDWHEAGD